MSGRRRRSQGRGTLARNPATSVGRIHQGGGRGGEGGSSGQPSAADGPMVGASEGVGGGGRDARSPIAATSEDGGLHLGSEGGEGGSDAILPGAAANAIDGQPRTPAWTAEEMQCQADADGSGRDGAGEGNGDQALVSLKGTFFLNEAAAINLPPLKPDLNDHRTDGDGVCDPGATDGHPCKVAMEKEGQVAADRSGPDGAGESKDDQALVSLKGSCFRNEQVAIELTTLQPDVNNDSANGKCGCGSGAINGHPCTLAEEKEGLVSADDGGRGSAGGNNGDQVMDSWKDGCFLLNAVMKWSVEDAMNVDLFKEKVQEIPHTFSSVQQYIQIHTNLLLEETRANVHAGLLDLAKGQTYHVLSVSHTATPDVYFIDVDLKKATDCFHVAEDGDLFLLSTQSHGELGHTSNCFAIATEVGHYSCFQRGFRVLVSKYHNDFNFQAIKHASYLTNIMGSITLSKAMASAERSGSAALESILWIDKKAKTEVCCCGELALDEFSPPNKFNDKQINAMKCILSKLRCPHINAPEVLWGPPGSGKTELAAAMIYSLSQWKFRILLCVPKEKNIGMFLQKFKALFPSFKLSDILVLNDMNGIAKCDTFDKMSLENRAQELYHCTYIWMSWMKELYFVLEMKPYCQDRCYHEGSVCKKKNLLIFCLESFREKICALIFDLGKCSEDLISSLSGKCLFDNDVANINKLMAELSQFEKLILNDILTNSDVQRAFEFSSSLHLVLEATKTNVAQSMNAIRISCLQLMDNLIGSFELPEFEDRKILEDFCLGHSRVIVCTPPYSSRLLQLKLARFDTLLVDDASQIKESDLLIPLSMAPKHVVLLGDHLHLQPTVESEVLKETGYASSLFERLLRLSSGKMMLTKQYVMHPSISLFVRNHFYAGEGEDAYNKQPVDESKIAPYGFFDITGVDELKVKGKGFVECAVVIFLLQKLCKGLANENEKLSVGILCLCSSRVDMIKNRLGTEYRSHDKIDLEVNTLDNSNEDWYDVVILSSVFDAYSEIPNGNRINAALTKSRHCLWIVGEATNLTESGGTWELLIHNAMERHNYGKFTSNRLSNVMKKLEVNDQKRLTAATTAFTGNIIQKPGQEWTWNGRPNNTKNILGSLRDQKNDRDTCTLQTTLATTESLNRFECSCKDPPQDFPWELCFNDLKSKYKKVVDEEIASEEIGKKRGKLRQETSFEIAKTQGIIGKDKSETEERERLFKLESYERVDHLEAEETEAMVEAGSIMACNFRLSRNYFTLRPGEVYVYDKSCPYIHPKSGLPVSHAVTGIGHGGQQPLKKGESQVRHVHIQNSEGKRFGDGGFGRVDRGSVRGLYRLTLPPPPPSAGAAPPFVGPAAVN